MTAGDVVMSLVDKVGLGGDSSAYTLTSFSSEGQLWLLVPVCTFVCVTVSVPAKFNYVISAAVKCLVPHNSKLLAVLMVSLSP